jgi:hypothetical protein
LSRASKRTTVQSVLASAGTGHSSVPAHPIQIQLLPSFRRHKSLKCFVAHLVVHFFENSPNLDEVRDKAPQARDAGRSQVNLNTNALHEVYLEGLEFRSWDNLYLGAHEPRYGHDCRAVLGRRPMPDATLKRPIALLVLQP